MTIVAVTSTPKSAGVSSLARTIVVTRDTSLAAISVIVDHLVADTTLLLIFVMRFIRLAYCRTLSCVSDM